MIRRNFIKKSALSALGISFLNTTDTLGKLPVPKDNYIGNERNIIFMVSDGMSSSTLTMANLLSNSMYGRESRWISLYREKKAVRAFMDTASGNSMVTDAAASSSASTLMEPFVRNTDLHKLMLMAKGIEVWSN